MKRPADFMARPCAALLSFALASVTGVEAVAQGDPLGLSREFGAFVEPAKAEQMIADCDAQTARVQQGIARWRTTVEMVRSAQAAHRIQDRELQDAKAAVAEAEDRADELRRAEVEPFNANVLAPRRARLEAAQARWSDTYERLRDANIEMSGVADSVTGYFRSIGLKPEEYTRSSDEVERNQVERCKRLRAWARLGREAVVRPQPAAWPQGAITAWKGQWSCRWRSTVRGAVLTTTVAAKTTAGLQTDGTVLVRLSTDRTSAWPGDHPSHIFSPLVVTRAEPLHGAFANNERTGETRVNFDAVDAADIASDGRLTFQRRYGRAPGSEDRLECSRTQ